MIPFGPSTLLSEILRGHQRAIHGRPWAGTATSPNAKRDDE